MAKSKKLELACPVCGSAEVFYSCTPNCCFNHVCAACGATFEPVTVIKGGDRVQVEAPDPLPEAADPTAACARCDGTAVYQLQDGRVACGLCGTILVVEYTEVAPA